MKNLLKSLFGTVTRNATPEPLEYFGRTHVKRSRGVEILGSSKMRKAWCQGIRDHIKTDPSVPKEILIDQVLIRFALFVGDLPASKRDHESESYGLLDHSLEIAHEVVMVLSKPGFKPSPDPAVCTRERPAWVYAGFLAALLHDVGRVLDLVVSSAIGKESINPTPWNPRVEPLVSFLESRGMKTSKQGNAHFLSGRGMEPHAHNGAMLHSMILQPAVMEVAGLAFTQVVVAYSEKKETLVATHIPDAAKWVSAAIGKADGDHREETRKIPKQRRLDLHANPKPDQGEDPKKSPKVKSPSAPATAPSPERALVNSVPKKPDSANDNLMEPEALLDALGRYIESGQGTGRNMKSSNFFIRLDWTWILFPTGFKELWEFRDLIYGADNSDRILNSLSTSGLAYEQVPGAPQVLIRPRSGVGQAKYAVGIKTSALFPTEKVKDLGLWPHEVSYPKTSSAGLSLIEETSAA